MKQVREAFENWIKENYGLSLLWDPQPLKKAEPHLRMTFAGAISKGKNQDQLSWQMNVVGAGDGPEVFLDAVIAVCRKVADMYDSCRHDGKHYVDLTTKDMKTFRVIFEEVLGTTGSFSENETVQTELSQWRYTFIEPHIVTFDFSKHLT